MRPIALSLMLLFTLSSCMRAQTTEFSAESLSGKLLDSDQKPIAFQEVLQKQKGRTTVIEIWASWCSDCVKAMPKLKEMQGNHPEVSFVFISMDKATDKWLAGIEKHNLKGAHYFSPDGMKGAFGASVELDWIPRYIILDKNGKIITWRAIEKDFDAMDQTLNKLKS